MIRDLLKALALSHALPIAGLLFALSVTGYGAYRVQRNHERAAYFQRGYEVARDSARMAGIQERRALAVAHAQALADSAKRYTAVVDSLSSKLHAAPRYTPRIEAIALPDSLSRIPDPVGVSVASTGEHFVLPRRAAQLWFSTDSLLTEALKANAKFVVANKQWAEAWSSEHEARLASDSLVAILQARVAPPAASPRRWPWLVAGIVAGAAITRIHH